MSHLLSKDFFDGDFPLRVVRAHHGSVTAHCHEFFELVYLRSGRGTHRIGEARYPIQCGDVYVISPGEPHAYHPIDDAPMQIVNVLFLPEILDRSLAAGTALSGLARLLYVEPLFRQEVQFAHRLNVQGALAYRVETILDEMLYEQHTQAPGYDLLLKSALCTLLVLLSRAYEQQIIRDGVEQEFTQRHAVVEAAILYIEAHYTEPLSLAAVARHTSMSTSRLAHLFKEHTHRSILSYLHEYRINRICDELLRGDAPVSDLATTLGYGDLRFFHRVFRRQVGYSPAAYRRLYRVVAEATVPARER